MSHKKLLTLAACLFFAALSSICPAKEPQQKESATPMDSETTAFLETFGAFFDSIKHLPIAEQRATLAKAPKHKVSEMEPIAKTEDKAIPGRNGPINIRLYSPKTEGPLPIIVYYHGGGWVYGSLDNSEAFCRRLSNHTGALVASIEYRLSPEHKFPIPLHDCYDATKWVAENASTLQGNPNKLIVCGDSAGGNLAAAVALMNQEKKLFPIAGQLLIYPVLTTDLEKQYYDESLDKRLISYENMQFFIDAYLSSPEDGKNPYAAPLKAKNLSNLPSCFVMTAEYDALKYEGARYKAALSKAGTKAQYKCYNGVIHGFLSFPPAEAARAEAMDDIKAWVDGF
jgi:acetyl esterase